MQYAALPQCPTPASQAPHLPPSGHGHVPRRLATAALVVHVAVLAAHTFPIVALLPPRLALPLQQPEGPATFWGTKPLCSSHSRRAQADARHLLESCAGSH